MVVNVFDDTTNSVSAGSRSASAPAMSAPSTLDTKRAVISGWRYAAQRPVGHRRTEVGAADADVDDGADAPPGRARPRAVADLLGEGAGAVEHVVDLGHDVATVDLDDGVRRGPQRDVQHGAALGDVDRLTGEHRVTTCRDPGRVGDGEQRGHHGVVDALLGVVDAQVADVQHVALGAARVRRQELAQVGRARDGRAGRSTRVSS